jgi:hypothetical protein
LIAQDQNGFNLLSLTSSGNQRYHRIAVTATERSWKEIHSGFTLEEDFAFCQKRSSNLRDGIAAELWRCATLRKLLRQGPDRNTPDGQEQPPLRTDLQ